MNDSFICHILCVEDKDDVYRACSKYELKNNKLKLSWADGRVKV
jgi:hypothetical protein